MLVLIAEIFTTALYRPQITQLLPSCQELYLGGDSLLLDHCLIGTPDAFLGGGHRLHRVNDWQQSVLPIGMLRSVGL